MPTPITRLLIALFATLLLAAPANAADTPFSVRYAQTLHGNLNAIGNTLMTCPAVAANCAAARGGSPYSNNDFTMGYVDVDSDASTFDSSSASLTLPAGSTVAWAGLYWAADTSGGSGGAADSHSWSRDQVKLKLDSGAYQTVAAASGDVLTSSSQPSRYRGYADVTRLVTAGGTYTVANVKAGTGSDRFAGWSLFVAYRDAGQTLRHVNVYDGLGTVDATHSFSTTIAPFQTPASGAVTTNTGLLSFEGDPGYATETMTLNGATWSNAVNPANNVFNSTISSNGALVSAKSPNYANQLGMDLDSQSATGALANSQSSTTLSFASTQDYYMPSAFFLVSDEAPAINTGLPSTSGTPGAGSTLTADPGSWQGTPTITYDYQWQRCDASGANCADIPGATGSTYDLTDADVGRTIRVVVVATNDAGASSPATSAASAVVLAPPHTLPTDATTSVDGSSDGGNGGTGETRSTGGAGGSSPGASTAAPVSATSDGAGVPAGSLLDATSCQQLAGNAKYRRVKVAGVGTVRVRAYTTGAALQTAPVQISTQITGGRAKAVRYRLDGRALRAGRAPRYAGAITPAQLATIGAHEVQALVTGKRGTETVALTLKTVACTTLFTAQRWRTTAGAGLRLRVDTRGGLKQAAFTVPAALLPEQTGARRTIGFMRVWVAGSSTRQRYALRLARRGAAAVALRGAVNVRYVRGGVQVSGLPVGAAIVEVTLYRVTKVDGATTKAAYTLRAQASLGGGATSALTARPLAPR